VWIPASGWLGDRFGTKRIMLFALFMFVGASALCGAAQTINQLIAFRVLQGVGGGMLTPVGLAMLFRAFPPSERARAATITMIPTMAAPALGPIIGGLLVTNASWRWIFYLNLPIGVGALIFGVIYLREHTEPTAGRFDLPGFVLSGAGLALVVYALSEGPTDGWTSPTVVLTGTIGALAFVGMTVVELRVPHPMLQLRLFVDRMFRNANITSVFAMASFVGLIFVMPLYLQNLRGLTALESGLTTFPQAIGILLMSQVSGRLYPRIGPRRMIAAGMITGSIAVASFALLDLDTSLWWIRGGMFVRGLCMGFAFVPMQAATYATIKPADNGRASSLFSTQRQMAVSIGVAILATVIASYTTLVGPPPDPARAVTGYRVAFLVAAGLAFVSGLLAAILIRDEDAAPSLRPRQPSTVPVAAAR
jgi:EmrB/QacA subfamily drug resistance transporter